MLVFWNDLISYDTFTQESNDEFQHYDEKGVCALTLLRVRVHGLMTLEAHPACSFVARGVRVAGILRTELIVLG